MGLVDIIKANVPTVIIIMILVTVIGLMAYKLYEYTSKVEDASKQLEEVKKETVPKEEPKTFNPPASVTNLPTDSESETSSEEDEEKSGSEEKSDSEESSEESSQEASESEKEEPEESAPVKEEPKVPTDDESDSKPAKGGLETMIKITKKAANQTVVAQKEPIKLGNEAEEPASEEQETIEMEEEEEPVTCAWKIKSGPRKGHVCGAKTVEESDYCKAHYNLAQK